MLSRWMGCTIIDETQQSHLQSTDIPTIYLVSHNYSFIDILLTFDLVNKATNIPRIISGVANIPNFVKLIITTLFNYVAPFIRFIPHNTCDGNTSILLANELKNGNDIFIWQHAYNKHKSLYYIISEVKPRLVYINISNTKIKSSINTNFILYILYRTICSTYRVTSKVVDYSAYYIENSQNIYDDFNVKLWDDLQ